MSLGATGVLDAFVSHALGLGIFQRVNQHEPVNPPGNGISCAIWVDTLQPTESGLDITSALLVFKNRIYSSAIQRPLDEIDPNVLNAVDILWTAYIGDFTLGGLVKNVDVRGMSGIRLSAQAGYVNTPEAGGPQMRVMTITLPVQINDVWTESP